MSDERLFSFRNPWLVASVGATAGVALIAAFAGLIWFPLAQPHLKFSSIWDAICSAAGVPRVESSQTPVQPAFKISQVVLTAGLLNHPSATDIGQGATLAQGCAICHGARGISASNAPNLAGQHAVVIYKELNDFRSDARFNGVMTPFAGFLTPQQILQVAAYYAQLPPLEPAAGARPPSPKLVVEGAPMRDIAPCDACHGDIAEKLGAPRLDGQSADYIKEQLRAFASGERHNDLSEQMRNIARQLTADEIDKVANYYASLR